MFSITGSDIAGNRKKRQSTVQSECCIWVRHSTQICSSRPCCKTFLGICI